MQHNNQRPSETHGGSPEPISFVVIQREVVEILDDIRENVADHLHVPAGREDETNRILASLFAEIELEGVKAVERLRRLRGDAVALLNWRAVARRAMVRKVVTLLDGAARDDDDEDRDDGDPPVACPVGPGGGGPRPTSSDGVALQSPGSVRLPLVAHPQYLATTEDVGRIVLDRSRAAAARQVGSWSEDSEEVDAIAAAASEKVLRRYQRLWNPTEGSLLAYLSISVRYAVHDEYIRACKRKANGQALIRAYERQLAADLRTRPDFQQDPRDGGLQERELEIQSDMERLDPCIRRLNEHQRYEIERRLREDDPGRPDQQSTHSRAVGRLRRMVA